MNWREKLICHILLIIAKMIASDDALRKDLHELSERVRVHTPGEK